MCLCGKDFINPLAQTEGEDGGTIPALFCFDSISASERDVKRFLLRKCEKGKMERFSVRWGRIFMNKVEGRSGKRDCEPEKEHI